MRLQVAAQVGEQYTIVLTSYIIGATNFSISLTNGKVAVTCDEWPNKYGGEIIMRKSLPVVLILIVAAALLSLAACDSADNTSNSQQTGIWVNGDGKVYAEPDLATLSLGVEAKADTIDEASAQATQAMDQIMASLEENGVEEKDIQTSRFSIYPITKWDIDREEEIQTGFRVTNMVTAKIRELEKTGQIIDAVIEAGGDFTRVNGISFSVEDPTPYQNQAREKAFAAAKAKAEQLANLSGVKLGKVTYVSENSSYYPVPMSVEAYKSDSAASMSTSISPGEQEISISVQISYGIE